MCDPITIAGVALSAGSMVANNAAQNSVAKARSNAMSAERIRQGRLQQETDALNAASRGRYDNFDEKRDDKASSLGAYFNAENQPLPAGTAADGTPTEAMPSAGSNNIVVREQERQKGKAKAFSNQQGQALGELRSFGDLLADTSRLQGRDAAQVGTLGGFMRGSSSVLPFELEAANSKGSGMKMFGDILGGLGSVTTAYGLGGGSDALFGVTNNAAPGVVGPQLKSAASNGVLPGSGSFGSILSRSNIYNPFS